MHIHINLDLKGTIRGKILNISILHIKDLDPQTRDRLLLRSLKGMEEIEDKVRKIIEDIKTRGDESIADFYREFFKTESFTKEKIRVTEEEIRESYDKVSYELIESLEIAKENIRTFHASQLPKKIWFRSVGNGALVGQVWKPIESVGIYVPGGRANYPSTALMLGVPAKVAGVKKVVAATPPRPDGTVSPATLVALDMAGVDAVYRVGGAHAIAAFAYGTESIPKVLKVVGPGNVWVAAAKKILRDVIDIEFIAGPSEVLALALEDADPYYVAKDLIAQAEHDPSASAVAVTLSLEKAREIHQLLQEEVSKIKRSDIVTESLSKYGAILVAEDLDEAVDFVNNYAPEHLEIMTDNIDKGLALLGRINNAGSIFIGNNTPVPMGDYITGTNHTLPTGGNAKTRGSLGINDFIKLIDVQILTKEGIETLGPHAVRIAEAEELYNHAESIKARLKKR